MRRDDSLDHRRPDDDDADDWRTLLADADVVVNAAGALQDGARDTVAGIHDTAVRSMVGASQAVASAWSRFGRRRLADGRHRVPSLEGTGRGGPTASGIDWVILRPTWSSHATPMAAPRCCGLRRRFRWSGRASSPAPPPDRRRRGRRRGGRRCLVRADRPGTMADLTEDAGRSFVDTWRRSGGGRVSDPGRRPSPFRAPPPHGRRRRRSPGLARMALAAPHCRRPHARARSDRGRHGLDRGRRLAAALVGGDAGRHAGDCPGASVRPAPSPAAACRSRPFPPSGSSRA